MSNPTSESHAALMATMVSLASMVKVTTGVANNAALNIMYDCLCEINGTRYNAKTGQCNPPHPNYRHHVKKAYKQALQAVEWYERRLLYATQNRFFCVQDMSEEARRSFSEQLTDREYFEFWKATGNRAYKESRPLVTSLWNKYRLSLINHHVPNPEMLAWPMVGMACLELAVLVYENVASEAAKVVFHEHHLPIRKTKEVFAGFSLRPVATAWNRALQMTQPDAIFDLEPTEDKNIQAGILQLADLWASPDTIYDSTMAGVEDYDEVFKTKGFQRKAMREIAEVRAQVAKL